MRVTFCGTASGGATAKRAATCILLDDGERGLLLDCGPGSLGALFRAGLALPKTQALVVSHLHMDHIHGFPEWLAHLVFPYSAIPRVYGPAGTRAYVEHAVRATSLVTSVYGKPFGAPFEVPVIEFEDGADWEIPEASVRSIVVPHAPEVVALAHRVSFAGRTIVYSGDTRAEAGLMVPLAEGGDMLIHEAYSEAGLTDWTRGSEPSRIEAIFRAFERTHTRVDVAARIAEEAGIRTLVLTHLCPGEQPERLAAEAQGWFSGEVVVAEDELSLRVPRQAGGSS